MIDEIRRACGIPALQSGGEEPPVVPDKVAADVAEREEDAAD